MLYSFSNPFNSSNNRWTKEGITELEKELGLALGKEQGELPLVGTSTLLSPRLVKVLSPRLVRFRVENAARLLVVD
jgi:hypothetical protein